MVDPVGSISNVAATRSVQNVAAPAPVAATRAASGADEAQVTMPGVAREMAASPPVDTDRVAKIKKAIADGTFPIYPATIADRLMALKLQWHPNDAA